MPKKYFIIIILKGKRSVDMAGKKSPNSYIQQEMSNKIHSYISSYATKAAHYTDNKILLFN